VFIFTYICMCIRIHTAYMCIYIYASSVKDLLVFIYIYDIYTYICTYTYVCIQTEVSLKENTQESTSIYIHT